jgi:hypothetical protein
MAASMLGPIRSRHEPRRTGMADGFRQEGSIMKWLSWMGLACVALLAGGCAHSRYGSDTLAPSRMYDVANFNGEWKLIPNSVIDQAGPEDWFLPAAFRIDGDRTTLRIEDDSGDLISEIAIDSDYRNGSFGADRNDGVRTRWLTDRSFQVERVDSKGRHITQRYSLGNRGRQLTVEVLLEPGGASSSSSRVYRRV